MAHNLAEVHQLAETLVNKHPDPVPCFRLLRDVLPLTSDNALLMEYRQKVLKSKWVEELGAAQEANGIWSRFHSQDSSIRKQFPTSEFAIRRALALGLDKDCDILKRAVDYMVRHLQGLEGWSDPPEKHEGWPVNIRFVTAGTLAQVDPNHPILDDLWSLWAEIVGRVFYSGVYSAEAERQAHQELNHITTKNKYMKLWMMYPLLILSSTNNHLNADLESALLNWLWHSEKGIYYIYSGCLSRFPAINSKPFWSWFEALEVLSKFTGWRTIVGEAIEWLWDQRNCEGWWDFGQGASASAYFPLSSSWRKPGFRQIDCSVRVLALLQKYYGAFSRNEPLE